MGRIVQRLRQETFLRITDTGIFGFPGNLGEIKNGAHEFAPHHPDTPDIPGIPDIPNNPESPEIPDSKAFIPEVILSERSYPLYIPLIPRLLIRQSPDHVRFLNPSAERQF